MSKYFEIQCQLVKAKLKENLKSDKIKLRIKINLNLK